MAGFFQLVFGICLEFDLQAARKVSFLVSVFVGADHLFADVESLVGTLGADTEVGFEVHFAEEVVAVSVLGGEQVAVVAFFTFALRVFATEAEGAAMRG